jgi:hypothetical protein
LEQKPSRGLNWLAALSARAGSGAVGIKEATMYSAIPSFVGFAKAPWNKGRLIGQKRPLRPRDVWVIRVRLQVEGHKRDLALFNLAIDSKLRGCDLVSLQVDDVCVGGRMRESRDRDPKEDWKAGPVRDHGADPLLNPRLAVGSQS